MSNPQDPSFQQQPEAPVQEPTAPPAYAAPAAPAAPVYQAAPAAPAASAPTNTLAVISMISSIVGWFSFGVLCIVGVVLGHMSLKQLKTSGEGGRGMAMTGLIVGYIGLAGWIIGLIIFVIVIGVLGAAAVSSGAGY
ncbi:DUF4190 domain-containing protein [Leucobacter sp. UT-8R-CII-1-4]|uniref:DUF4190 domain-containing protein n=1 Tax=Leucobacter sp. UT-8R-CII-1-4 TaxID=3040075 RepID=UPI0024A9D03A|nr:DUF4190 domain-containing protein [Leucobacter sp. UT-8R-CII-1-4]MDI6023274.1 DUF4190 domain-containing protein [Leucobacter sp. UT-8R-CII-1-4]